MCPEPVQHVEEEEVIEAGDGSEDFSDVGSSIDSDSTSLTSSIANHVYENGRRYHSLNAGTYSLPNDETEQERLDLTHHTTSMILRGELQCCTLPAKLDRVLDLGTGTGIWAIDFADQHPESQVIGVDLSPIQPSWVPPNCTFEVDDVEKPWLWKHPFNFIHSGNLGQGIRNWPQYLTRIHDSLVPNGKVELLEYRTAFTSDDDSIPHGGFIEEYEREYLKAAEIAGIIDVPPKLEQHLKDAGFVDVRVTVKKHPIGGWPKDKARKLLGQWGLLAIEMGLKSYGVALFTRCLGWSSEKALKLCEGAYEEFCRREVHGYYSVWFLEGRKPTPEELI